MMVYYGPFNPLAAAPFWMRPPVCVQAACPPLWMTPPTPGNQLAVATAPFNPAVAMAPPLSSSTAPILVSKEGTSTIYKPQANDVIVSNSIENRSFPEAGSDERLPDALDGATRRVGSIRCHVSPSSNTSHHTCASDCRMTI